MAAALTVASGRRDAPWGADIPRLENEGPSRKIAGDDELLQRLRTMSQDDV